jgi:hypothetical protein
MQRRITVKSPCAGQLKILHVPDQRMKHCPGGGAGGEIEVFVVL